MKNRAVLFELELVAVNGRKALFEALQTALKAQGVALRPVDYSRFFIERSLELALPQFLAAQNADCAVNAVLEEVRAAQRAWASGPLQLHPVLLSLLNRSRATGVVLGATCSMDQQLVETLANTMGIGQTAESAVPVVANTHGAPGIEAWKRLARTLKVSPLRCLALAGGMKSARSAMAAGMRCVAIEDEFNTFQDFSGVDFVAERLDEALLQNGLDLV